VRVVGIGDQVQHDQQHHRDRPAQVQGRRRTAQNLIDIAQIAVQVGGRALRRAGQQFPGVRQDRRIVVDVDDPGRRHGGLRDQLLAVGSPVPMSRNCPMPHSTAR
jgi:hypothetical protein